MSAAGLIGLRGLRKSDSVLRVGVLGFRGSGV